MPGDGNNGRPGSTRREDSFLARWSRRKHEAEHGIPVEADEPEETPEDTAAPATDSATAEDEARAAEAEAEPADAELPHPDTLDRNSDFSAYLTKRVSSTFRRAAMRRLFSSPGFNVRDGLDDYDEDYTQFQSLGNTVTAHMRHHAERLRQRDQERAEQAERDAEAERERTGAREDPEQSSAQSAEPAPGTAEEQAASADDPTPADAAPDPNATARTPTSQDTDDTT